MAKSRDMLPPPIHELQLEPGARLPSVKLGETTAETGTSGELDVVRVGLRPADAAGEALPDLS
jgi:hypothetical protein